MHKAAFAQFNRKRGDVSRQFDHAVQPSRRMRQRVHGMERWLGLLDIREVRGDRGVHVKGRKIKKIESYQG